MTDLKHTATEVKRVSHADAQLIVRELIALIEDENQCLRRRQLDRLGEIQGKKEQLEIAFGTVQRTIAEMQMDFFGGEEQRRLDYFHALSDLSRSLAENKTLLKAAKVTAALRIQASMEAHRREHEDRDVYTHRGLPQSRDRRCGTVATLYDKKS